jgi:hypothetical protein
MKKKEWMKRDVLNSMFDWKIYAKEWVEDCHENTY